MTTADERSFTWGVGIGVVLVILGVAAYVLTEFASVTALIPSMFGVLFVALGRLGSDAGRRRIAIYGLTLLAFLGVIGSFQGLLDLLTLATGGDVERPVAAGSQAVMTVLCLVLLGLLGRSFADGSST